MKFLKLFTNWIFPPKCMICHCDISQDAIFCASCFSRLTFISQPFCKICGKMIETSNYDDDEAMICNSCLDHPKSFDIARSLFQYDNESKKIIMKIKKEADNNTSKICSQMLIARYINILKDADFIIPVPSHWTRILKRGYNPSNIIALEISKILKTPCIYDLKRTKKTDYQKNKTTQERFDTLIDAFSCQADLNGKSIILVDDVFTTGATLSECSKILKKSGAINIICITIATTPSRKK